MRLLTCAGAAALLLGCEPVGSIKIEGVDTASDGDADADADGDTDADSDADTDTAPDPDVEEPVPDIVVDCKGSGDFEEIQDAIDAAVSPARIGVKKCEYHERLDFLGKIIDLYGIDGSADTILDGDEGGTVVDIEELEAGWTRFAGFTVTGGYDPADGAGMEITKSSVELEDVVFEDNEGYTIVRSNWGNVDMVDVTVEGNDVDPAGQAVFADGGNLNMDRTTIDCDGGAQGLYHHVQMVAADSTITCDSGYGVYNYHGEEYLVRSRFEGGVAGYYAHDTESTAEEPDSPSERFYAENSVFLGGSVGADVKYMTLHLSNSVFSGGDSGLQMTACSSSSWGVNNVYIESACGITGDQAFSDTYGAYWDNTADGCGVNARPEVSADPEFVDFPDDLTLDAGSPLIDAGSPSWDDPDGSRSDIGRYGGPHGW